MRILLATDGSPQARGAEALAEWLAYKLSAPLTVLFVVDTRLARIPELLDFGALTVPVPVLRTELERALALRGEAVLDRVRQSASAAGVAVEAVLEEGVPHEVILRRARAADLLVLGRSGEAHGDGFGGLGSTADRVLRASPVPVLLAPGEPVELEGALLGYDASESAVWALHALAPLARALGLGVRVVSVHEDPARAEAWALEAEAYLRDHGVEASALVLGGDAAEHLLRLQGPGDLLALGAPVRWSVFGSTAERVIRNAQGPLLTAR